MKITSFITLLIYNTLLSNLRAHVTGLNYKKKQIITQITILNIKSMYMNNVIHVEILNFILLLLF